MDEPDIPMLDVGDFEVLDECAGEDDIEEDCDVQSYCGGSYVEDEEEEDYENDNPKRRIADVHDSHVDDNSGDNADNILDVSIDLAENEFLENVAKDFSENIEDQVEEQPRRQRYNLRRGEPTVQIHKLESNSNSKKVDVEPEVVVLKKKPGPKSKTMNVQSTPAKKPIQKISFSNDKEKNNEKKVTQNVESKNIAQEKIQDKKSPPKKPVNTPQKSTEKSPNIQQKTPAFLKNDLTDEEIMIHFDEIENTVLTSDSFVIENDLNQSVKEYENKPEENNDTEEKKEEEKKDEANDEEENWDATCDQNIKQKPQIKIEEEELKESEMWYKEKIKAKENSVEERFTKLAKIIQYSYPLYKKWLDKNESLFGTAICKVESSKHIPLDQLHPNRWKFICNKKHIQQSSKEDGNQAEKASDNKSSWQMIPGVADANVDNAEEYPPFVMRVVKVFEEFLQSLEDSSCEVQETQRETEAEDGANKDESENKEESKPDDKSEGNNKNADEKSKSFIENLNGLTVLLRCNRKEELMMHITGKNISAELMDKMKDLFENGPGKDCNVKSLYCKTIIKNDNGVRTNNTFLFGSETLDDTIGNIKIQLAPKANVWANLAGVEIMTNVITNYLVPTKKTTVIEIGCSTGIISLLLASKCQKVIGVDVQKEIVEAEILCELNEVKNATFLTGKPKLVMSQIDKSIANSKAVAIINTNSAFGRSLEVISSLRQMTTLGRIIIITTLTKQAIRSILELTQPADEIYGNPFIPIKACIVDTTPKSYGFDIVMSMERRTMRNLLKVSPVDSMNTAPVGLISKSKQAAGFKYNSAGNITVPPQKVLTKFIKGVGKPGFITGKKYVPNPNYNPVNKYQGKRPFPGSDGTTFHPGAKKFKQFDKPYLGPNIRPNPLHDKKMRDEVDLRERLSSGRVEPTVLVHEMQEQKKILDAAKEKLSIAGSSVDVETVKKLQEMLNLAIEKTNKLQSQLPPRSVWDRIAPPDSGLDEEHLNSKPPLRGRLVKEAGPKEIIITTSNDRDGPVLPIGKNKKYHNLPPLEPNLVMPVNNKADRLKMSQSVSQKPNTAPYQKPGPNRFQGGSFRKQDNQSQAPWNRNKLGSGSESQMKWNRSSPSRQILRSPPRQSVRSPPRQSMRSPPRSLLRTPPRKVSPPRRPVSPVRRPVSPPRRPVSPPRRPVSPAFRQHSSSSRNMQSSGRPGTPPRRHNSPPRRPVSPHNFRNSPPRQGSSLNRQKSPSRRYADEWDIPSRNNSENLWTRPEKEKTGWQAPPSSSSNWNQSSSTRYRSDSEKWDNRSGSDAWNNPPSVSQSSSSGRWKDSINSNNTLGGTNWDVKKDSNMRDMGRHERRPEPRHEPRIEPRNESRMEQRHETRMEPRHEQRMEPRMENRHETRHESRMETRHEPRHELRHESRHEPRHESRWENPEKAFRNDKDDWGDLPEDARDPWGDNDSHPPPPAKDSRWSQQNQSSSISTWSREKPSEINWSAKPNFPINSMGTNIGSNSNANMNMVMGMNNPNKPIWQTSAQQTQQPQQAQQPNRNQNWLPPGNWQIGTSNQQNPNANTGGVGMMLGSALANWQPSVQSFSTFASRPFNANPFMNNRH